VLWTGVRRACATEGQILKRALTTVTNRYKSTIKGSLDSHTIPFTNISSHIIAEFAFIFIYLCAEVVLLRALSGFTARHDGPVPQKENVLNVAARPSQPVASASWSLSAVRVALALSLLVTLLALILALGSGGGRVDRWRWRRRRRRRRRRGIRASSCRAVASTSTCKNKLQVVDVALLRSLRLHSS